MIDRHNSDLVLIVDDVPDNLSVLHDALDEFGYTVLVATNGEQALQRAAQALPDIILLDALMPGLDGFEVARRLKADPATSAIPIVFMTGLTETEHVLSAFQAGGIDYVTKPIRPMEVLARIAAHVQGARERRQARNALDAFGHATLSVRAADGRVLWQTPLARQMLLAHEVGDGQQLGEAVLDWLQAQAVVHATGGRPQALTLARHGKRLTVALHEASAASGGASGGEDEWLLVMSEASDESTIEALGLAFRLTAREAEVLYWVVQGKTNRDIGEILGTSPRTVHKHLEHVFEKLGVETRTAAAGLAMARVRQLAATR
ncbi:MAG: response regulator transcription factor [Piscinibacter sp.]|uniref:response regulator transcription factor n=1 Tax=Piscinibacter sp. TaxID=1903157 RepID=UPI002582FC66|nr:response regulator transcription factor [Piscinibacter sp.]MCW5666849.1 response regulator transcription factor [Piscinibacter sp.]